MGYLYALLQGLVQGLTEFLPISSSGHMEFFRFVTNSPEEGHLLFSVLLHLGTLAAVILVYRKTLKGLVFEVPSLLKDVTGGTFDKNNLSPKRRQLLMIMLATLPLPLTIIFNKLGSLYEADNLYLTATCFILSGVLMLLASHFSKRGNNNRIVTAKIALIIGLSQAFAGGFSGISRSGTTIAIALLLGLHKETAVNFSFLIGIPAIVAAAAYEMLKVIVENESTPTQIIPVILGIIVAAVVGIFAIQLLRILVKKDKFHLFAIYCFLIGIVSIVISAVR